MSNTTTVSPYDEYSSESRSFEGATDSAALAATSAAAVIAAVKWICGNTEEQKAALQDAREEDKKFLIKRTVQLSSVALNLRDERAFIRSAMDLGYKPRAVARELLMLEGPVGQRIAVTRSATGKLVAHSNRGRNGIAQVVHRHSLDQVQRHLKAVGMDVAVRRTLSGDIELAGIEGSDTHGDGRATVSIQVNGDGSLKVDVDRLAGPRCERLIAGIAQATGGGVTQMKRKHSYFERPGEVAKTKVTV